MRIKITEKYDGKSYNEYEGTLEDWFKVLDDNDGAEAQTGSSKIDIIEALLGGKFIFAGFVGCYYEVENLDYVPEGEQAAA
jgi:hypothetical protein